jgi:hypothetical protein
MTQYGEGPMTYYKLQIEKPDKSWWITVLTTTFGGTEYMQEDIAKWKAKGRETRVLKIVITEEE